MPALMSTSENRMKTALKNSETVVGCPSYRTTAIWVIQ